MHIKVVCLRNYLNCERGIRERESERYIKITKVEKQSGTFRDIWITTTFHLHFPQYLPALNYVINRVLDQVALKEKLRRWLLKCLRTTRFNGQVRGAVVEEAGPGRKRVAAAVSC